MGKRTRHMTGKTHAKRPRDLWPTIDPKCVPPLLAHLPEGIRYAEPLAGGGHLKMLLDGDRRPWRDAPERPRCVFAADLSPGSPGIVQADALSLAIPDEAEVVISNPPWTREMLHRLIVAMSDQRPTYFLFDADWQNTAQAARFAPRLRKVIHVGRLIWVHGTTNAGFTACCWYLFDRPKAGNVPQVFLHGAAPPPSGGRTQRVCPDCGVLIDRFGKWELKERNGVPTPVHKDCRHPSGEPVVVETPLLDWGLGGE